MRMPFESLPKSGGRDSKGRRNRGELYEMVGERSLFQERRSRRRTCEGEQLQLIKMVCKKLEKNKAVAQIADELETEEAEIVKIIEAAREFAPEYDVEKILEKLNKI